MAQDTALLRYLLRRGHGGAGGGRDLAFAFDGTNDYISSNATIGRTGYDMNVSGNVTTGSDEDGSYIQFNGNRDHTAGTGTLANITSTGPTLTQAGSFTMSAKFKIVSLQPNNASGIFGYNYGASIWLENTNLSTGLKCRIRESGLFQDVSMGTYELGTTYTIHLVYNSSDTKMYCYLDGVLVNSGGNSVGFSFTDSSSLFLGDSSIGGGNPSSANKYIYHAAIRNKALTQAEIDDDIALGHTAKSDPSIVAYYIPENLTYNTQYIANPKDLSNASWAKFFSCSVSSHPTVAPDGTTTADTVTFIANHNSQTYETNTSLTGSTLASKTYIIKAFVKVATTNKDFRLKLSHVGVADYQSGNLTATTTRQEFTFTQTFTSSTSGTGINIGVMNATPGVAGDIQVRNVRLFLVNETLRDESPNIGGFIGWKTQKVLSCRVKPNSDTTNTSAAGGIIYSPGCYLHDRGTSHTMIIRYDDRIGARQSSYTVGGAGFRNKVHVLGLVYWTGSARGTKLYINGVLQDSDTYLKDPSINVLNTSMLLGRNSSTYFAANIRDARIYTFTGSFTDADALAIYNGGEPTSSGITKYLHYRPPVGEVGTTTQDQSPNDRDGTLNGGVTRDYI